MRRFFATAAATAALVLSVPQAAAAAPEPTGCTAAGFGEWCFFPAPADWEKVTGGFWSCQACQTYARQGVEQGRWSEYHCEGRPQGLDYLYDLYIPPEP